MIAVLGGLADVERDRIRTRTAEGRERAKARGQHMGRPLQLTAQQQKEARRRRAEGRTAGQIARATLARAVAALARSGPATRAHLRAATQCRFGLASPCRQLQCGGRLTKRRRRRASPTPRLCHKSCSGIGELDSRRCPDSRSADRSAPRPVVDHPPTLRYSCNLWWPVPIAV
jgi:hypothetical protein